MATLPDGTTVTKQIVVGLTGRNGVVATSDIGDEEVLEVVSGESWEGIPTLITELGFTFQADGSWEDIPTLITELGFSQQHTESWEDVS